MSLWLLVTIAISLPVLLILALLSLSSGTRWLHAHPKGFAVFSLILVVVHGSATLLELRAGADSAALVQALSALAWLAMGGHQWFRGRSHVID